MQYDARCTFVASDRSSGLSSGRTWSGNTTDSERVRKWTNNITSRRGKHSSSEMHSKSERNIFICQRTSLYLYRSYATDYEVRLCCKGKSIITWYQSQRLKEKVHKSITDNHKPRERIDMIIAPIIEFHRTLKLSLYNFGATYK